MRNLNELNVYRRTTGDVVRMFGSIGGATAGVFDVPSEGLIGPKLMVIASSGMGWDHVSVSLAHRCPYWHEMEQVKRLFFLPHETAMQLHVPPSDHINYAKTALHLWRPLDREIPRPPAELVGAPRK